METRIERITIENIDKREKQTRIAGKRMNVRRNDKNIKMNNEMGKDKGNGGL